MKIFTIFKNKINLDLHFIDPEHFACKMHLELKNGQKLSFPVRCKNAFLHQENKKIK